MPSLVTRTSLLPADALSDAFRRPPVRPPMDAAAKALSPARNKTRALVLTEITLAAALIGDHKACAEYGIEAAGLTQKLSVGLAADLLHRSATVLLPHSSARLVRSFLTPSDRPSA